jgi:Protein of unknown function (DUF3606)
MSDDLKNRGVQDRARINLSEEHEVRYAASRSWAMGHLAAGPSMATASGG